MRRMSGPFRLERDERRAAIECLARRDIHGRDRAVAPRLDGGFQLHALDHQQRVAARDRLARRSAHRHRPYPGIGASATSSAEPDAVRGMALHRIGVADRVRLAVEVDVHEIAVDRDDDIVRRAIERQHAIERAPGSRDHRRAR